MNKKLFVVGCLLASLWLSPAAALKLPSLENPGQRIDLNNASPAQLLSIPGVGRTRSREIIRYRRRHPFKRISELLRIPGIGRRTYLKIKPYVWIPLKPEQLAKK